MDKTNPNPETCPLSLYNDSHEMQLTQNHLYKLRETAVQAAS